MFGRRNNRPQYEGHDGRGSNNVPSNIGRGNANPTNTFLHSYKVYSPVFADKPVNIERGNKIILPSDALQELSRMQVSYPMTFMITNPELGMKSYVGCLEFSAPPNQCFIPTWLMDFLCVGDGSEVIIRNVNLPKGRLVKFQPHETAFIDIPNIKSVLENELTYFSCLHKGDTITINHAGRNYMVNITDAKPNDAICVVECDLNMDFDAPLDYKEPVPQPTLGHKTKSTKEREIAAEEKAKVDAMAAKMTRMDGRALTDAQRNELLKQIKEEE